MQFDHGELLTLQQSYDHLAVEQTGVAKERTACPEWPVHTGQTPNQLHQAEGLHH